MEAVLGFVVKYVMQSLYSWGVALFKKKAKYDKIDDTVDGKRDRVIKVLKDAPKGELMNDKQRKELYEAYSDLARL